MKKSIRINNSVVEIKDNRITVYRKGEVVKEYAVLALSKNRFLEACNEETLYYINK